MHEVHTSDLRIHQVRAHRNVVLLSPFFTGQQGDGGAVGQRGGVTGSHRGLGTVALGIFLSEDRLELGKLFDGGIWPQVGIAGDTQKWGDQIIEEAFVVGFRQLLV